MDFQLHNIHPDAIPSALEKAKQYRLLQEPDIAESICLDILQIDAENQQALVVYILALTDQLQHTERRTQLKEIQRDIDKLTSQYQQFYYSGLLNERYALALLSQPMSRSFAYDSFMTALHFYQQAIERCPEKNDEAILRWNSCIRTIGKEKLQPRRDSEDTLVDMES